MAKTIDEQKAAAQLYSLNLEGTKLEIRRRKARLAEDMRRMRSPRPEVW